jgi:hypothetical protein
MIDAVLRMIFRCSHRNMSRPMTPARRCGVSPNASGGTYVVCLDCGTQLPYDWEKMRLGRPVQKTRTERRLERKIAGRSAAAPATRP